MAGWLVVWSSGGAGVDPARWDRAVAAAARHGARAEGWEGGSCRLAAWRRDAAEFPRSGRLVRPSPGVVVAWVGQCLEDQGDVSDRGVTAVGGNADAGTLAGLNGPFAAAIVRDDRGRRGDRPQPMGGPAVRIVLDRHRHYPVYLHRGIAVTVASTELACVIPWIAEPRISREASDLLLRTGELIDRLSIVEGVEVPPGGVVLEDFGAGPREREYWSMRHAGECRLGLGEAAELVGDRLRTAVRRTERCGLGVGVTLSGGLDSRVILDLCADPGRVPAFTWGLPGCRDIACAAAYARRAGVAHTIRHWEPGAFPPAWARGVEAVGGSAGIENMFMLPFLGLLGASCGVVLNGLAGDVVVGGNFLRSSWLAERDLGALAQSTWQWRVGAEDDALATRLTGLPAEGPSGARARWEGSIRARASGGGRPVERLNDWLYDNRVFRNTNCGTMLLRTAVESHAPFFDRDLTDAVLRVPLDFKLKHRLYLRMLARLAPRAAAVAWQRTALPPAWGYAANLASMAGHRALGRVGKALGLPVLRSVAVADVPGWFRGAWRAPAEGLLLSERALGRGLFDPAVVRAVLAEHAGGANRSRQLGVLVSVELIARSLEGVDRAGGEPAGSAGGHAARRVAPEGLAR